MQVDIFLQTYEFHASRVSINVNNRPERKFRVEAGEENALIKLVESIVHLALLSYVERQHAVDLRDAFRQRLGEEARSIRQVGARIPIEGSSIRKCYSK